MPYFSENFYLKSAPALVSLYTWRLSSTSHDEQLAMILPYLNSLGMDLKLPSVSFESRWQEHAKFLELCNKSDLQVFVKIIVSEKTDPVDGWSVDGCQKLPAID